MSEYNIYCDESCHLEHDQSNVMALGAIILPKDKRKEIKRRIIEIKAKHGVKSNAEIKWTKLSESCCDLYLDLVDYFFDDDDLGFRVLVADKTHLNHEKFNQTHDDWYYKMYFDMLKVIFEPSNNYYIYIDIKDTLSAYKQHMLHNYLANKEYDFSHDMIRRIQPIRSEEVQVMQLTDILTGAVCRINRNLELPSNSPKLKIIRRIQERSKYTLVKNTALREYKMNVLIWKGVR